MEGNGKHLQQRKDVCDFFISNYVLSSPNNWTRECVLI